MHLRRTRCFLPFRALLIIVTKRTHDRARNEFTNICQYSLAIIMATIRLQSECRVAQATQIAHGLPILDASKLRIVEDRFFEFGVRDLTFGASAINTGKAPRRVVYTCMFGYSERFNDF